MASWQDVADAEPDFAARVRRTFAAAKHATLATLRRDGSPRISGSEVEWDDDGQLYLGMMTGALKALDLRRDPRLALHCPTVDPPEENHSAWLGDGKLAGVAVEIPDEDGSRGHHRFRIEITEVVLTTVGDPADHLVLESWHPGRGYERVERR